MMLSAKSEEVDFVAVDEEPEVKAQRQKVSKLASELESAERAFLELAAVVNPPDRAATDPSVQVDRLQFWEAQSALPAAKLSNLKYRLEYERESSALRELRNGFRKELTTARARSPERRALLKRVFETLRLAEHLLDDIADFDMETAVLGGDRPLVLFPDFLGGGRESYINRRERLAKDRGELD